MNDLEQQVTDFLESDEGNALKTLLAFTVRKTKTLKDDQILEDADKVVEIAKSLTSIKDLNPTDKEAKNAGLVLLKWVAAQTKTKWDDFIVGALDKIV